ncbi:MAG: hypothetical protein VW547_05930 [Alphaproteobacteria bacterium]
MPENVRLVALIKDIHINVIQVQQRLIDISTTRGRDGRNEEFGKNVGEALRSRTIRNSPL